MVVISDSSGKAEIIELDPHHIVNGGKEVHVTGITTSEKGVVILVLEEKKIPEQSGLARGVQSLALIKPLHLLIP